MLIGRMPCRVAGKCTVWVWADSKHTLTMLKNLIHKETNLRESIVLLNACICYFAPKEMGLWLNTSIIMKMHGGKLFMLE